MEEKCLKTLSEYRERRWRGHVWWKMVPEGGAGNRKSPFANGTTVQSLSQQQLCFFYPIILRSSTID